jgi:hypothetical protein
MTIYRTPIDGRPAVHAGGNQKATDFSTLRADLTRRLDHSNRSVPTSPSTRSQSDLSTREREKARSATEVVAAPLLAVLVVALAVTSIVGLTIFGDHGNAPAAVAAGAIGMFSAVLGLIFGFMKAHHSSY